MSMRSSSSSSASSASSYASVSSARSKATVVSLASKASSTTPSLATLAVQSLARGPATFSRPISVNGSSSSSGNNNNAHPSVIVYAMLDAIAARARTSVHPHQIDAVLDLIQFLRDDMRLRARQDGAEAFHTARKLLASQPVDIGLDALIALVCRIMSLDWTGRLARRCAAERTAQRTLEHASFAATNARARLTRDQLQAETESIRAMTLPWDLTVATAHTGLRPSTEVRFLAPNGWQDASIAFAGDRDELDVIGTSIELSSSESARHIASIPFTTDQQRRARRPGAVSTTVQDVIATEREPRTGSTTRRVVDVTLWTRHAPNDALKLFAVVIRRK
jgi:hypothetical protein